MSDKIVTLITYIIAIAIGYYIGSELKDKEWRARFTDAPSRRDTTTTVHQIPIPQQTAEVKIKPRITESHRSAVDSSLRKDLLANKDTISVLREKIVLYTAPRETTIVFDEVGELFHRSERLTGMEYYALNPFPQKVFERIITDSIFVPTPSEQPWYDHWYWGVIGTGVVIIGANQLK